MTERVNRRDFLRALGVGLGASVLAMLPGERREGLNYLPTSTLVLDFAPEKRTYGIIQDEFPDNEESLRRILGGNYLTPKEFVIAGSKQLAEPYAPAESIKGILGRSLMGRFKDHGEMVVEAMKSTWGVAGVYSEPYLYPLQNLLGPDNLVFKELNPGVMEMSLSIKAEQVVPRVKDVLSKNSNLRVLNMSFQMGKTSVFCNFQTGQFWTLEAYQKDRSGESIPELVKVCQELPDLCVVAAGGNIEDDIMSVRGKYERGGSWPDNLILAADWNTKAGIPRKKVYGMDVYTDSMEIVPDWGSSYSAGSISAISAMLKGSGAFRDFIIHGLTEPKMIEIPESDSIGRRRGWVNVLDFSKVALTFKN